MEVVSAEHGALGPLLGKLTALLAGQYGRLKGVRREIRSLRSELTSMHAALKSYSNLEDPDDQVKAWISLVRELAYDAEDVFDKFIHHHGKGGKYNRFKEFFRQTARHLRMRGDRREIAKQIDDLKACIEEIKEIKTSYKLDTPPASTGHAAVDPRPLALFADGPQLVGMDGPIDEVAQWMVEQGNTANRYRRTFAIVGFGGLGKTALANAVYRRVQGQFQCSAFVSISQKPDIKKIVKDVISQVPCQDGFTKGIHDWDEIKSITKLRELLQDKRYLVIVDDLWSVQAYKAIKCAFPENNCSSRIIVTTRIVDVAKSCCPGGGDCLYEMEFLSDVHSRRLFFKRIFGSEDCCPDLLKEISDKILKKCGGVPLAIISISCLLANKRAVKDEWEKVKMSIGSALEKNSTLEGMNNILSLSYNALSPNLKTCLLSLSAFPWDYVIESGRLVWRWIAEGFISEERGQSRQEVAKRYFYELINRNMIQPVDIGYDGEVRSCRVHGMMLEIIISKSIEDNFVTVLDGRQTCCLANHHGFIRRLSIQHIDQELASALANQDLSHVRSLTVASSVCVKQLPSLDKFEVLRVVDFEDCEGLEEYIMSSMGNLFKLKYLRLRGKMISELPPAIMMLNDLMTLDLSGTGITNISPEILMLHHLEYLDLSGTDISSLPTEIQRLRDLVYLNISGTGILSLPPEIHMLRDLEHLNLSGTGISELPPEIVMLNDLAVLDLRGTHIEELPAEIGQLTKIEHLHISSETGTGKGKRKLPNGIGNMINLWALTGFNITNSSVDAVEELGNLISLRELGVQLNHGGSDEYKRHEEMLLSLVCKIGSRKLRSLSIHKCRGSLQFLDSWSPLPFSLETFCMSGDSCFANIPKWIVPELTSLVHLEISLNGFREEGLHTLGKLPALRYLKLSFISDPVEVITVQGTTGFRCLNKFAIYSVAGAYVSFMEGAMPKLEKLNVRLHVSLAKKYDFHLGIQHLPCLQEVAVSLYEVDATPSEIRAAAATIKKEACDHPNHPTIKISGRPTPAADAPIAAHQAANPTPLVPTTPAAPSSTAAVVLAAEIVAATDDGTSQQDATKVWCLKCQVGSHLTTDCKVQHYCYICDKYNHTTWRCHVLKQPKPTLSLCGPGHAATMFYSLPDALFKESLALNADPNALITVSGDGTISAADVEKEVTRLVPAHSQWKWKAVPNGDKTFVILLPSHDDLARIDGMELMVRAHKVMLSVSAWKKSEITPAVELQQVWVHVNGVPHELRHFLGLWGVGAIIGTTLDVDLLSLRRRGLVRILVGMIDTSVFMHDENGKPSPISSNLVIKLKGYEFRYEMEKEDFIPEADFKLYMWKKPEEPKDRGNANMEGGGGAGANKRSKNNDSATSASQLVDAPVPMSMAATSQHIQGALPATGLPLTQQTKTMQRRPVRSFTGVGLLGNGPAAPLPVSAPLPWPASMPSSPPSLGIKISGQCYEKHNEEINSDEEDLS